MQEKMASNDKVSSTPAHHDFKRLAAQGDAGLFLNVWTLLYLASRLIEGPTFPHQMIRTFLAGFSPANSHGFLQKEANLQHSNRV